MAPIDPTSDPENVAPSNNPPATPAQQPPTVANATPGTPTQQQQSQPSPAPQSAAPIAPNSPKPAQPNTAQPGVSNTPQDQDPSVQRAGRVYKIAQTLAGNPTTVTIDPQTGQATRQPARLSRGDLLTAIAMEALSGSLAGLAQRGPGATGRAAEAGYQQVAQQKAAADQQQEQQASADFARQASAYELANRTRLNVAQAERMGIDSLKDAVAGNADLLSAYEDQGVVSDSHVSQDALLAGMKNGTYSALKQIAIPDGWTNVNGKYEQTFSIINNPSAKVPLTQEQAQMYAAAGIPGFAPYKDGKTKVPVGATVSGTIIARANAQLQAQSLMRQDFNGVLETLQKSSDPKMRELAAGIPSVDSLLADPQNGPVLRNALAKFQRYVSHSDQHGMDFYQSLQQMAQPSMQNPRNPKQFVPNPDAGLASTIAGAFGGGDPQKGWDVLKMYHDQVTPVTIKSEADAANVMANNSPGSRPYQVAQKWVTENEKQKAADAKLVAQAKKGVTDADASGISDPALARFISPANVGADGVNHSFLAALQQKNPARASLIQSIGQGRTLLSKYGLNRKDGQALVADVAAAYPDFDQNKVEQYETALKDFAPGGKSGKNLISLNTALTHLQRSYDHVGLLTSTPGLSAIGSWLGVQGAGAYKSDVNALASEIATAYKGGVPDKDEVNRWYSAFTAINPNTVRSAYTEAANLLLNKVDEMHDRWADSVPSSFVAPIQFITDSAAQSFQHVTGQPVPSGLRQKGSANTSTNPAAPPPGATMKVPGSDGKLHWSDGKRDLGVAQ